MNPRRTSSSRRTFTWPHYQYGFGNEFSSEALPGALPKQNNPQHCPYSLYAEQITGVATETQHKSTWMYRIRPSAVQGTLMPDPQLARFLVEPDHVTPERLRWSPITFREPRARPHNFVEGLITMAGAGDPADKNGLAIYLFTCNRSMVNTCFSSSDGDLLIVPEIGTLRFQTELGNLIASPGHIVVIPRGIKFAVKFFNEDMPSMVINEGAARGYILEVYSGSFELPNLSVTGGISGLANPKDFRYPTASFEEEVVPGGTNHNNVMNNHSSSTGNVSNNIMMGEACGQQMLPEKDGSAEFLSITKFQGGIFKCTLLNSPFDVVAWSGNYAPFAYDLSLFCPVSQAAYEAQGSYSIFTVLRCASTVDFIVLPPKWYSPEDTLRVPFFQRSCMTAFLGVIFGSYEGVPASVENQVVGGGNKLEAGSCVLYSTMAPHGPDAHTFQRGLTGNGRVTAQNSAHGGSGGGGAGTKRAAPGSGGTGTNLAFMVETSKMLKLTDFAMTTQHRDVGYSLSWHGLGRLFNRHRI